MFSCDLCYIFASLTSLCQPHCSYPDQLQFVFCIMVIIVTITIKMCFRTQSSPKTMWKTMENHFTRVWKSMEITHDRPRFSLKSLHTSTCRYETPVLITVVRLAYQYNRNHCPPTFVWSLNLPSLNSILHPFRHLRMWLKSQMPSHKDMFLLADQNVVWICMDQHTAWWAVTNIDPAIARNIHRSYHCTNGGVLKSYNFAV